MKPPTIQYQFALSKDEVFIDINSLTEKDRKDYVCIGCGKTLRPILGKIRRKHFRHKTNVDCSLETYLHRMGKKLFKENYKKCIQEKKKYIVEFSKPLFCNFCQHGPCEKGSKTDTYDLTKAFTIIHEEKRDGELIPDLLLKTKNGDKIYIEIAVTHTSSHAKIASQIRIIEFSIQVEDDLALLQKTKISLLHEQIRAYNFAPEPIMENLKNDCHKEVSYFTILPNGKCKIKTVKIFEFDSLSKETKNYIQKVDYPSAQTFIAAAEQAFYKRVKIKNCFLCRYHAINTSFQMSEESSPIFCKFHKKQTQSNYAANCEIYRADPKAFESNKSANNGLQGTSGHGGFPKFGLSN